MEEDFADSGSNIKNNRIKNQTNLSPLLFEGSCVGKIFFRKSSFLTLSQGKSPPAQKMRAA
jgi:hypothetical protein